MNMQPEKIVRKYVLPDPLYFVEVTFDGMDVFVRVIEERGRFTITREIYETRKDKPRWLESLETFKRLALRNYSKSTNSMANLYKSGS